MKEIMYGFISNLIVILTIILVVSFEGQTTRENEIDNALPTAVEQALSATYENGIYTIDNNEEFIAEFTQLLLNNINVGDTNGNGSFDDEESYDEKQKIKVDVTGIDYKKGLLSIRVTETYTALSGKEKEAVYETTAILERPQDKEFFTVCFYLPDNELFHKLQFTQDVTNSKQQEFFEAPKFEYSYRMGSDTVYLYSDETDIGQIAELRMIKKDTVTKKEFAGWDDTKDDTDEMVVFPQTISENKEYIAVYQ